MKVLGDTGLVRLDDVEEWQRVRAALIAAGYIELNKSRGIRVPVPM